jgi:inosose dehydratase
MAADLASRLGIQSWCFRGLKGHERVMQALRECGVDRIELSAAHLQPTAERDLAAVVELYRRGGVTISSYGVYGFDGDEGKARGVFELARLAGFDVISADLKAGGLEVAERLCREYGKRIAIHNHGRRHRLGPVWALEELFGRASKNVGLCLDTAWMIDSGEDPVAVARKFADRLYGLHVKDFVFDRAGKPEDVVVGQGNLDLAGLLGLLVQTKFGGYFTLEYEGDVENPVPAVRECVEAIRKTLAGLK